MTTAFLQIHLLVVILFLLLFGYKAILLFINQHDALIKVRSYSKILDILFGALVLVTGGFLAFHYQGGWPTWLWVKIVLVFAAIPLAIIGLRKHSKALTATSLLIFLYVYGIAETKSLKMRPDKEVVTVTPLPDPTKVKARNDSTLVTNPIMHQMEGTQLQNTKAIYSQVCATCHGEDGQKGAGGAVSLQSSLLSLEDRQDVIANGRGLMPGYRSQLTEQEIEALAVYTTLLQ